MLERLELRNFQRHRKLEIEFDPCVTTIIGPTDAGKSAIVRALRWLILNQPRGRSFVRWGAKKASAALVVDGIQITRTRGSSENLYFLDDSKFAAFGNNVPEEIASILRMTEANFQSQMDAPFWLSATPGEVSRQLNAVVDLGAIDSTLANLASMLRSVRSEENVVVRRVSQLQGKRNGLKRYRKADRALEIVEVLEQEHSTLSERSSLLASKVERVQSLKTKHDRLSQALSRAEKLSLLGDKWKILREQRRHLRKLIRDREEIEVPAVDPVAVEKKLGRLLTRHKRLKEARSQREDLESSITELAALHVRLKKLRRKHSDAEFALRKLHKGWCPLCKQPFENPFHDSH